MEILLPVEFEWDRHNVEHIRKRHRIEPSECEEVFFSFPLIVQPDTAHSKGETRRHALGKTSAEKILLIVFTIRNKRIRVVTAREASGKERGKYEKA